MAELWYNGIIMKKESSVKRKKFGDMPRRPSLFWDVDPKTVDPEKHARYIIERILEFGTDEEVRWMWNTYPHSLISDVLSKSRVVRPLTKPLWQALTQ